MVLFSTFVGTNFGTITVYRKCSVVYGRDTVRPLIWWTTLFFWAKLPKQAWFECNVEICVWATKWNRSKDGKIIDSHCVNQASREVWSTARLLGAQRTVHLQLGGTAAHVNRWNTAMPGSQILPPSQQTAVCSQKSSRWNVRLALSSCTYYAWSSLDIFKSHLPAPIERLWLPAGHSHSELQPKWKFLRLERSPTVECSLWYQYDQMRTATIAGRLLLQQSTK